ncbi:MAG: aspartate carbamoyltransferase catalytic subunit [Candidatus Margulisbacteria bacterium]|nr:aspartate carbamoyltransferase catalytic subunit [Candidatus Margulisiibacteriota bacterium]
MKWKHKDLLGLRDLTPEEISFILDQAKVFKEVFKRPIKQVPALRGKTIVNLFYEPSTRTRTSFDMAAKMLGASTNNLSIATSSVKKGETLIDTVKNLEVMGISGIVIRHAMGGAPHLVAKSVNVPVINAGDGFNEHPTQGLLDIFTMRQLKGNLKGKKVIVVGDIAHSRVARSNAWGLTKLGAEVTFVAPPTLIPKDVEDLGVSVSHNFDEVIGRADFINILRMQLERQYGDVFVPSKREYNRLFGLTAERMKRAKKDVVILHPGPMNRGVEIDSDVADGPYNVILDQVTNGVAVRMAIIFLLMKKSRSKKQ